jgi:hypothetical protein
MRSGRTTSPRIYRRPLWERSWKLSATSSIDGITQGLRDAIEEAKWVAEEADEVDLPRGFGKD